MNLDNLKIDARFILLLSMLAIFCGWLVMIGFWFLPLSITEKEIDPMMTLVAGFGAGGITNSLLVLITLSWQFYFRKKNEGEGS